MDSNESIQIESAGVNAQRGDDAGWRVTFDELKRHPSVALVGVLPGHEFDLSPAKIDIAVRLYGCRAFGSGIEEKRSRRDLPTDLPEPEMIASAKTAWLRCQEALARSNQEYALLVHVDGDKEVDICYSGNCEGLALSAIYSELSDELLCMLDGHPELLQKVATETGNSST